MTKRERGIAALNLEMTDRVYRMEYSVLGHSELIKKVTGRNIVDRDAQLEFMDAWDMCMQWSTLIYKDCFGKYATSMGHAAYAENGSDLDYNVHEAFCSEDEVFAFDPMEQLPHYDESELIKRFEDDVKGSQAYWGDCVTMTGTYITAMSGLIDLLGWNMLLSCAGEDPNAFGALTDRYTQWMEQFFRAMAKADIPVVMVHDDIVWTSGAFMQPSWYRKHIFPAYERFFDILRKGGKKIIYTSDGTYTEFIDDIAACGMDMFVLEPTTDMEYIAKRYGKTHGFVGNADTRILYYGDKEDIRKEVMRCMNIGRDCPGFIMAVGNHIPPNTPIDSCLWYDEFCKEYGRR